MPSSFTGRGRLIAVLTTAFSTSLSIGTHAAGADITTLSVGVDLSRGDYGTEESTRTLALSTSLKHDTAAWLFRATVPYVWAEGSFSRDQGTAVAMGTQHGLGDLTVGVFHHLVNRPVGFSADVGVKVKFATADKNKDLITTGENDYSLQTDAYQSWQRLAVFGTLGYTLKGDPSGVNYRNPFYGTLGMSTLLPGRNSLGVAWDFREKVTRRGDPISELTLFYTERLSTADRLQFYALHGLSDGSPDIGGGLVFSRAY